MRKKPLLLFISISMSLVINAQSTVAFLDINRVRAAFWSDGSMFWNKISNPLFEWPKDSGTHINNTAGLWLGGVNSGGILKGAYMRYGANGNDYFPGPLLIGTATVDASTMALYNTLWKLNKTQVDKFILCNCVNPGDPACVGYSIPASIASWPGNPIVEADGDHLLMDQQLAPYFDANTDGIYNPNDCDYPLIKCDQSIFYVFNDRGNVHNESLLPSIGVEIRALAYACTCDSLHLEDAIFLDLQMIHRGTDTLYQTYIGLYDDGDIGGPPDDYMGTNVDQGYVYHYNADTYDGTYAGQQGYGSIPPALAIMYLQGPWMDANGVADFWDPTWDPYNPPVQALTAINDMSDTLSINPSYGINGMGFNDNIVDNEKLGLTRTKHPTTYTDSVIGNSFYRYQRAFWDDGSSQIYGGDGYPAGPLVGATRARFFYPDSSDAYNWGTNGIVPSFSWSEFNTSLSFPNPAADERSVSASGPFTLMPGEINTITYGFVAARSTTMADSLSINTLHQSVLNIKTAYLQGLNGCGPTVGIEELAGEYAAAIYPNPAHHTVWISTTDQAAAQIRIFDMTGRTVYTSIKPQGELLVSVAVETLAPGMYTMVINNSTSQKSIKFIRN